MPDTSLTPELFQNVFSAMQAYVESHYGAGEAAYFFQQSREKVRPYFPHVDQFEMDEDGTLVVKESDPDERALLAFAAWMQQFMKEIQQEIIGLPLPDIETLTEDYKTALETSGFYEFFRQAEELEFE